MMKRYAYVALTVLALSSCRKQETVSHFISTEYAELSANKLGLSNSGEALTLTVSSNIYWMAETDADWLKVFPVAGFGEQTQISFTIDGNNGSERSSVVRFLSTDGTSASVTVTQAGAGEIVNYLTLGFKDSFATYEGIGSAPVCVEGEGYAIEGDRLIFDEGSFVTIGPVQPRQSLAFGLSASTEGSGIQTYVSNKKELKNKVTEPSFYFDELTSFYICMTAPKGTILKGLSVNESTPGQGQYIHFGDGKPVGYVYFTDDFKWLSSYSDVDFIRTLDNSKEALWKNVAGQSGFNPEKWTLSDNSLKQRVYIHSNCLKFGRAANSAGSGGGIITPAFDVEEGYFTNIELKVLACAFYPGKNSNFDAESSMLLRIIGDGEFQDSGSNLLTIDLDKSAEKKAIWDSSNIEYRVNNAWEEYKVKILGVSSNTRIAIESTVETTKGRIMVSGVSVTKVKI